MGFPFVYCVVCGCPFDIPPLDETLEDRWASDDPLEDDTKQWLYGIRLIGTTSCLEQFATPPFRMPKNESSIEGFVVSEPAEWAITDGFYFRLGQDPYRVLAYADDSSDVLLPLHENCLSILRRALEWRDELAPEPHEPFPSLVGVYKALCAQFARNRAESRRIAEATGFYGTGDYMNYGMEFDHDYCGAREFWAFEGWMQTRANEWYCNDPVNIPGLLIFVLGLLTETTPEAGRAVGNANERPESAAVTGAPSLQATSCPFLEGLPFEIMSLIVSFLPTSSILSLRQCSKALASRLRANQQFWRIQLLRGSAIPFLWDLGGLDKRPRAPEEQDGDKLARPIESGCWDWKGLAKALVRSNAIMKADETSLASAPWGLRNRCRIWTLVNDILTLPVD
ncbi:hypothetical protein B0J15DRAFT_538423 [Fusarium solani]|uniref:F-box domain-containing protein n=1 Tax=Fusarium solani TaxID=169388 RepID=A0A9P9JUV7_FUSSL|nr:uncharacterized protein B0J15DRAFT_538423 [Fusarium solani]KAH7237868.1 hypothetical protein B0J15DRAFT_538423 [Fusarium solani]